MTKALKYVILIICIFLISINAYSVLGESDEEYLTNLYRNVLGREPDPQGFQHNLNALRNGASREGIINAFYNSPEYKSGSKSNSDFIKDLYKGVLGREPDPQGFQNNLNALNSGMSREDMINAFKNSAEYKQKNSGTTPTQPAADNKEFLTNLYKELLGREPDPEGLDNYLNALRNGMSREDVENSIKNSEEYKQKHSGTTQPAADNIYFWNCKDNCDYYFIAVPVDGWTSQEQFNQKVIERMSFFIDISKFKFKKTGIVFMPVSSECNSLNPPSTEENPASAERARFFREIKKCANSLNINYEKIVAFSPKLYSELGKIGMVDGLYGKAAYASMGWTGNPSKGIGIMAHEIGHLYGLCDEYSYSNWLNADEYLKRNYGVGCKNPFPDICPHDYCNGNPDIYRRYSGNLRNVCNNPPVGQCKHVPCAPHSVMGNIEGLECGYPRIGYEAVGNFNVNENTYLALTHNQLTQFAEEISNLFFKPLESSIDTSDNVFTILSSPDVGLSVKIEIIRATEGVPMEVEFNARVVGGNNPLSYAWDFNSDGVIDSTIKSPEALFTEEGTYLVSLTVTDVDGDTATDTVTIIAEKLREIKSPRKKIHIDKISFENDQIKAGEDLIVYVNFENQGNYDIKNDASVTVIVPDLALREKENINLKTNKGITKKLILETPEDAEPGIYDVMIVLYDNGLQRVRYRPIKVIG